jgi:hypothetical protein
MASQSLIQKDFSGAQVGDINISLAPQNSVSLALNVEGDVEIGSLVSRLGTARIGSQLGSLAVNVLGIFQHVDQNDTTKNKLFATINDAVSSPTNSDIYDVSAGTKSLQDDTINLKTYFLNYAGDTLRLNGTDAPKAYNSTSWITTGGVFDLANMPTGYKYTREFLSRVYLWGKATSAYTLAYSGVLTAGTVSWTSGNGTVEIEPEDNGGEATGLGKVPGYLLIFKRRSMHRWNYSSAFPESLVQIGAYSQESIVEGAGLCAFYSDSNEDAKGFYITDGSRPVSISQDNNRPMKKWVDAISATANVAGWATDRYFCWSVGDVTVDNEAYTNVVMKYNRVLNQWTVRSYPSEFKVFCPYVASGVNSIVGGDDAGTVYQVDKIGTYTDANTTTTVPIPFKVRTHHNTYGVNHLKTIGDSIVIRGANIPNLALGAIIDEDVNNRVALSTPTLWKRILGVFKLGKSIKGTTIALEIAGESNGARSIVREIEIQTPVVDVNYI